MKFLIKSYIHNKGYYICEPIDCHKELSDRNMSINNVNLNLITDGNFDGYSSEKPEELVGKTISCSDLQPFMCFAIDVQLEKV